MKQYLDLMRHVRQHGIFKGDRTGTGTYSVFAHQMRFDLVEGFPLVTTKKCHLKSVIHELLWFLKGDTNIKYLVENGVHIWTDWPLKDYNRSVMHGLTPITRDEFEKELLDDPEFAETFGNLGPVYGYQWRSWPLGTEHMTVVNGKPVLMRDGIDQIAKLIEQIKTNPDSRRLIVSAWNSALIDEMKLPPCHVLFQFYSQEMTLWERRTYHRKMNDLYLVNVDGSEHEAHELLDKRNVPRRRLSCQLYQRSADIFLGVPFNIASYALLTMMVAQVTDHAPGEFIWTGGDCHLYANHIEQADLQLSREPMPLPRMVLNPYVKGIDDFTFDDFTLFGYQSHPHIKASVAV